MAADPVLLVFVWLVATGSNTCLQLIIFEQLNTVSVSLLSCQFWMLI